jgi:hypothetical protein
VTYTFKLARRLAVSRWSCALLAATALASCTSGGEPLGPTALAGPASRLILLPSTPTVQVNQPLHFVAWERTQTGDSVPASGVRWSADGGTIGATTGDFVATQPGRYKVVGRRTGQTTPPDTVVVAVVDSGSSSGVSGAWYPNQPAGYVPLAESDASGLPPTGALLGSWAAYDPNHHLSLVTDASAPRSPGGTLQTLFPAGLSSGVGPTDWEVQFTNTPVRKLYFSMWVKIVGPDYENQGTAGTKMGFFSYGEAFSGAGNQGYMFLVSNGSQTPGTAFRLDFIQQNNVDRRFTPNVDTRQMTVGQWHHWEAVLEENTLGQANGTFRFWLDGNLTMSYADVTYITSGATNGFFGWKWNPTWGGVGGTKTRNDAMRIDHVFMSGLR